MTIDEKLDLIDDKLNVLSGIVTGSLGCICLFILKGDWPDEEFSRNMQELHDELAMLVAKSEREKA